MNNHIGFGNLADFMTRDSTRLIETIRKQITKPIAHHHPIEYEFKIRDNERDTVRLAYLEAFDYLRVLAVYMRFQPERVIVKLIVQPADDWWIGCRVCYRLDSYESVSYDAGI